MMGSTMRWLKRQHDLHKACVFESIREGIAHYKQLDKKRSFKTVFARNTWGWWSFLIILVALSAVLSIYHNKIALAVKPWSQQIINTKGSWAVPIAALIILSIPPLAGHELVILVVGLIWGLGLGFAIAIAGTWIGEVLVFYLFRYFFQEKARRIEAKSKMYYELAEIMRRDGLWMVSLVRFSALPGHVTTAIQSCIGISIWTYGIAAAISLPKQLCLVYLGVLFGQSNQDVHDQAEADSKKKHTIITWVILCLTGWLTFMAFYIIWFRIWLMRRANAAALLEAAAAKDDNSVDAVAVDLTPGIKRQSLLNTQPSLEYFTTASSGSRTPAPSYRENMAEMYPRNKNSAASLGSNLSKPSLNRTRSSTLASLAFNNNSLPYLPYTPMMELPNRFPPMNSEGTPMPMPSPVPAATMRTGSPRTSERDDLENQFDSITPSGFELDDSAVRLRRIRLGDLAQT